MFNETFRGLSITKAINGISKGLNIANELIPVFKNVKPMITNARETINTVKDLSNKTINKLITNTQNNTKEIKENKRKN